MGNLPQMQCNICKCNDFDDMHPNSNSIFVRAGVMCRACHSLERHRLCFEILQVGGYLNSGPKRVLHFAPERSLSRVLRAHFGKKYQAFDINPQLYNGTQVAELNLCGDLSRFKTQSFDIVIHNHVLEHLECDYRIILAKLDGLVAKNGIHIFTIPFMDGGYRECLDNLSQSQRLKRFGQVDHYRVFSPNDVAATIGSVVDIDPRYDITKKIPKNRLKQLRVPQDQWKAFNNNSLFILEKPGAAVKSETIRPESIPTAMKIAAPRIGSKPKRTTPSAIFISPNGIGRGHLNRQLAIATRMKHRHPVFLTMSYAAGIVLEAGVQMHFLPHHDAINMAYEPWNRELSREIETLVSLTGADTLIYDINFVFDGFLSVLSNNPALNSIWIRRAMWPKHHRAYLESAERFSQVIEPAELAQSADNGPTKDKRHKTTLVPPVLLCEPDERLERARARSHLGISADAFVVVIDILGTKNTQFDHLRKLLLRAFLAVENLQIVELQPVFEASNQKAVSTKHKIINLGQSYTYSRAWDVAVTRAGYNTFHEQILASIPTIFVPNSAHDLDLQTARSSWAAKQNLALELLPDASRGDVERKVEMLLDHQIQSRLRKNCNKIATLPDNQSNGAAKIALIIDNWKQK